MTKAFKYIRILPQNSVFEDFKILRGKQLNIYVPKKKKKNWDIYLYPLQKLTPCGS